MPSNLARSALALPRLYGGWWRRSLSARIVTVFLGLLVAIQIASYTAISLRMQSYTHSKLPAKFASGEQLLRHMLAQRSRKLLEDARLLASDYGFRQAVQSNDAGTIASALTNHGARIGAAEAAMLSTNFAVQAVSDGSDAVAADIAASVRRLSAVAGKAGTASEMAVFQGQPHQMVLVPMKAPMVIGWVLMGFAMPNSLTGELKLLSTLDLTLVARATAAQPWAVVQTTLTRGADAALAAHYQAEDGGTEFNFDDEVLGMRALRLTPQATPQQPQPPEVAALLSLSVSQAGRPSPEVQQALTLATLLGVVLFGVGSVFTARRVTTPLRSLAAAAERLGGGDYTTPIHGAERGDEVGDLAHSFEQMRISVATNQAQVVQSQKLASIGQLVAGVAHEINNPLGFVLANFASLEDYLARMQLLLTAYENEQRVLAGTPAALRMQGIRADIEYEYLREDLPTLMAESKDGLERVRKIVQDLKNFSHRDSQREWQIADLHAGLDSTLKIVAAQIAEKADVVKRYGNIPNVECLSSELNQVFMNLLVNAAHAIGAERGTITLATGADADTVWVSVSDTGSGIPPEIIQRIFDPFFTTKPVGKGTGLGLSLSYGIVKKHGGRIEVQTEPGRGTTFRVLLPTARRSDPPPTAATTPSARLPEPASV